MVKITCFTLLGCSIICTNFTCQGDKIEKIADVTSDSNWFSSTSGINDSGLHGTPGSANSQMSDYGDPFINEWSLQFNGVDDYISFNDIGQFDIIDELTIVAEIIPYTNQYS
mgnify:CR=1 FL=1